MPLVKLKRKTLWIDLNVLSDINPSLLILGLKKIDDLTTFLLVHCWLMTMAIPATHLILIGRRDSTRGLVLQFCMQITSYCYWYFPFFLFLGMNFLSFSYTFTVSEFTSAEEGSETDSERWNHSSGGFVGWAMNWPNKFISNRHLLLSIPPSPLFIF